MTETPPNALAICSEESEWLRGLARSLLEDASAAEDVAQDASLVVLQDGTENRRGSGWIVGLVRNLVATRRRQSVRRQRVERQAAVSAVQSSASEIAARVEQQRLLADAVLKLEKPFCDVILLRFYDGLTRREIARRLEVPVATINSRLARAIGKLRIRLDRDFGGDRRAWMLAIVPLATGVSRGSGLVLGGLMMKKTVAIVAAAIALLGLGIWVTGLTQTNAIGEAGVVPPIAMTPEVLPGSIEVDEKSGQRPFTTQLTREMVAAPEKQATSILDSDSRHVNLRLLDAVTREPIVAAAVHFTKPETPLRFADPLESKRRSAVFKRDLEEYLRRYGDRTDSDAAGHCLIPADRDHVTVVARKGTLFGTTVIDYDQGRDRILLLYTDASLRVTVVDHLGRSAEGVEVVAYAAMDSPRKDRKLLGQTDVSGAFSVLHVRSLAADLSSNQIVFAANPIGGESERIAVDPLALPSEGVHISMPPTGSWTIRITDSDGKGLAIDQLSLNQLRIAVPGQRNPAWRGELDADSTCRFEHVILDLSLDVELLRLHTVPDLAGPTSAEPNLISEIRLPGHALYLHARALDETGQVLADDMMQCIVRQEGERAVFLSIGTNSEGLLTLIVLDHDPAEAMRIEMRLWPDNDLNVELKNDLRLGEKLERGHHQLGDLRFDRGRLLAKGRVELVGGGIPKPFGLRLTAHVDGERKHIVDATTWPEPGVFEARGIAPGEQLTIESGDIRYQSLNVVEFIAGATDLQLLVTKRGEVTASFIVNEDTPWHLYRYFLRPRFAPVRSQNPEPFRLEKEGERVITNWRVLDPGIYDLQVFAPGQSEALAEIGNLEVVGGDTMDPRLIGIDLSRQTTVVHVSLLDPRGEPILTKQAGLLIFGQTSSATPSFVPASDGMVETAIMGKTLAQVIAVGYAPKSLLIDGRDLSVTLEATSKIRVSLQLPLALPDGITMRLHIGPGRNNSLYQASPVGYRSHPTLATGGFTRSAVFATVPGKAVVEIDQEGLGEFALPQPGDYLVAFELSSGRKQIRLEAEFPATLHWDGSSRATIHLDVPLAPFRAALEKLDR